MSVLISDIETAKLYVQFLDQNNLKIFINEPLAQRAVSWKCRFIRIRLWVVAYESLKTKEKSSWLIPKVLAVVHRNGCLRELSLQSLSHSLNGV